MAVEDGALDPKRTIQIGIRGPAAETVGGRQGLEPSDRGEGATTATQVVEGIGSACWARTSDPLINSQLLYQLS